MASSTMSCVDDHTAELYALNRLDPVQVEAFEEHLLICPACLSLVEEADEYVMLFQAAATEL